MKNSAQLSVLEPGKYMFFAHFICSYFIKVYVEEPLANPCRAFRFIEFIQLFLSFLNEPLIKFLCEMKTY